MKLKPVLNVDAVDDTPRCKITTSEEECEECLGKETAVVSRPDHGGQGGGCGTMCKRIFAMDNGSLCCGEVAGIDAASD